ncbi:TonB-dependent receptor domain-containing protein [Inhella sp.]|uniref:TonB-dependent receptor domain-containing protein n=1 Tax=Inhella sp. TaxID=1921806 RepID=UPI0035AE993C
MFSLPSGRRARHAALASVALAASLSCAPLAQAQALALASAQLDTVVLTTQRAPQRVDQALAQVTVIDRSEIEAQAGRTLVELLAAQPGIQFWSNGGAGKLATVSMRGLEGRHTLLLIDGVRYGSATAGIPIWDNLPLDAVERIEIVRGPLSALYGSDAVGGVVQIFTRKGAPGLAVHGRVSAGSHGQRQAAAGLRWASGPWDAALGLQASRDDGFSATNARAQFGNYNADRDGFDQDAVNLRLGLQLAGDWRVEALALDSRGETQFDDGPGRDARAKLRSQVLSLQASGSVAGSWRQRLRAARALDENNTLVGAFGTGLTASTQKQLSWEHNLVTPAGELLGVLERNEQSVQRPGAPYAVTQRSITGLGLGLNGRAERHHWQLAAGRDRNSQFGGQTTGSAAYGLDLNEQLRATASWGSSFAAPNFNQLYFPNFGNPKLLPEEGTHRELALRWVQGAHQVRATWFQHRIRGYITSGQNPTNVPRAEIEGLSLGWEASWQGGWSLNASLEALNPRNLSNDKLLVRRAKEHLRLALQRDMGAWMLAAQLRSVGDSYENATNTMKLDGYTVLDLHAQWRLAPEWALGLKLNNAADVAYETTYGFNQPRREWLLTLRYGR